VAKGNQLAGTIIPALSQYAQAEDCGRLKKAKIHVS